ncbi:immunoglobulin-like domain-containing protein [Proteiniclasticum sp.]|uniref:immunoglobulin-like domain-containing protein n=1 Tax=Proteiniclasticum sp. TaxID=2053595 RepID=UPI00289A4914|nr:immunoglobulin-like domain-containing protein [Proteiniclasticum sp.]
MKKMTLMFIAVFLSIAFTGCKNESYVSDLEINNVPGVSISEVTPLEDKLNFNLVNESDQRIYFGADIRLERKRFGKWYKVDKANLAEFPAPLYDLSPESKEENSWPLEHWKNMKNGDYRLIKEIYITEYNELFNREEPGDELYYIVREFEL